MDYVDAFNLPRAGLVDPRYPDQREDGRGDATSAMTNLPWVVSSVQLNSAWWRQHSRTVDLPSHGSPGAGVHASLLIQNKGRDRKTLLIATTFAGLILTSQRPPSQESFRQHVIGACVGT
jgi:hypothetical protein